MKVLFCSFLLLLSAFCASCGLSSQEEQAVFTPPSDDSSNLPWNRPIGPEGGGMLGMMGDR